MQGRREILDGPSLAGKELVMTRRQGITFATLLVVVALAAPRSAPAGPKEDERLRDAGAAYHELLQSPDRGVPQKLLEGCRAIAVFPGVLKGALGWGGRRGHGVISVRQSDGHWSPPCFMTITGGSFGFQIGVEKTDVVLFIMSERSARSLVKSEFTLGAKGGVAAGPVGRSVEGATDIKLDAEIYSYARAKGLFAGVSIEGARIHSDPTANRALYGSSVDPNRVLFEGSAPNVPESAHDFLGALPQ
jgi:lipid-binding SYLF domain-containing protein